MIPVLIGSVEPLLNPRITRDTRVSKAQRDALWRIATGNGNAHVVGLDAEMRPVVRSHAAGPDDTVEWALLRNGAPRPVTQPMAEEWS